jgi:endonuclease-8
VSGSPLISRARGAYAGDVPEGDTVYATAHRLTEALGGAILIKGELRHPRLATADLAGRTFRRAVSVGKHLFLRFDDELSLHCHLGMDGSWRVYDRRPPIGHRVRAVLATADRYALGTSLLEMALVRTPDEKRLVSHLGPDLLDPDWSDTHHAEAVRRLTATPERELADALLDQRLLAGIGNVYKAELCFLLGVSPWTPVSEVDAGKAVSLSRELLLRNALRPIRNTTGDPRRGRETWVYGRQRTGCLRCGGRVVVAGQGAAPRERVTYYCPHCQPGPTP